MESVKRTLLLYGGWEGHTPEVFADLAEQEFVAGHEIVRTQDLDILDAKELSSFDLILPIWTFGTLTEKQELSLMDAVANGLGYVGWHGNASSFLENRLHKLLLGGQFVAHPGGNNLTYSIHFLDNDPLVSGLVDTSVTSEQYYLLVDPAVKILATTEINGADMTWLAGVTMPVAWKRKWGKGRVFYCALGHTVSVLEILPIREMITRAICWATRGSNESYE